MTERARVGQALDLLRDALYAYVDAAMAKAYGQQWDERVADEDAKRRRDGRKFPVSKSDLAVMLKVIQHERIPPWSNTKANPDPRIRSFASEILTLRNLFSHGDDCIKEHARLLDTGSRLLQLLDLPVPGGLEPPERAATQDPSEGVAVAGLEQSPIAIGLFETEAARHGESGKRLLEILKQGMLLTMAMNQIAVEYSTLNPESPAADSLMSRFQSGALEGRDLFVEANRLESDNEAYDSEVLRVVALAARCLLADDPVGKLIMVFASREVGEHLADHEPISALLAEGTHGVSEEDPGLLKSTIDPMALLRQMLEQSSVERWREVLRLAQQLNDGDQIPNLLMVMATKSLLEDSSTEDDDALRFVRHAIASTRMLAAMDPGSAAESGLVWLLRREGKLCNNLGLAEEAIRAFARADEIVDRYPAADPDLRS